MRSMHSRHWQATEVGLDECVHYGGFRYGHDEYHPYETYVTRLHRGDAPVDVRAQLLDFLRWYRPRRIDQALGIALPRPHPLWLFPWHPLWKFMTTRASAGWYDSPARVPDVMTSFSPAGIPRGLLEREYHWLQDAYESIARQGYRPERYGYPAGRLLIAEGSRRACLLLDGNHRVSAISALGHTAVTVMVSPRHTVRLEALPSWPGVRARFFTRDEAQRVFMAYFSGNHSYRMGDGNVNVVD